MAKKKEEEKEQKQEKKNKDWTEDDINELIRTIKRFPPGTANRWKVIADTIGRNQKDVISKAKDLQDRRQGDVEAKR